MKRVLAAALLWSDIINAFAPKHRALYGAQLVRAQPSTKEEGANVNDVTRRVILDGALTSVFVGASGLTIQEANAKIITKSSGGVIPTTKLGGLEVSRTIQGYWQLAGGHGDYKESDALQNMRAHFDAGITTLDTADIYGPSEVIVGKFVVQEPRAVVCTKFCCFRNLDKIDMSEVRARIQKQCARLNVKSLPLVAFFWADYSVKRLGG